MNTRRSQYGGPHPVHAGAACGSLRASAGFWPSVRRGAFAAGIVLLADLAVGGAGTDAGGAAHLRDPGVLAGWAVAVASAQGRSGGKEKPVRLTDPSIRVVVDAGGTREEPPRKAHGGVQDGTSPRRAGASVPGVPCWRATGSYRRAVKVRVYDNGTRAEAQWTLPDCRARFLAQGTMELAADESDIVRISPGGSFVVEERTGGGTRRVELRAGPNGTPVRSWSIDGNERSWGPEARRWMAVALPDLLTQIGFNAPVRSRTILRQRGPQALLDEIPRLDGSDTKSAYLEALLDARRLDAGLAREAARMVIAEVRSDHYRQSLLRKVANASGDRSDEQMAGLLIAAAEQGAPAGTPPRTYVERLLASAALVRSDSLRTELLLRVPGRYALDGRLRRQYLQLVDTLDSASARQRARSALDRAADGKR